MSELDLVTNAEIARRLGVPRRRVTSWADDHASGFPSVRARVGRMALWEWPAVRAWAASRPEAALPLDPQEAPRTVPAAVPVHLPAIHDAFVGRRRELADLVRLQPASRVLTLSGPPGIGKTRLAVELAAQVASQHPDGVWLIDLAGLTDPALVCETAAGLLGVQLQPGRTHLDTLVSAVGSRRMLLILDNCEHVVDACGLLASALAEACCGVRILATSQEQLGIAAERVWPVPPLSLPDPEQVEQVGPSGDPYEDGDAVALFRTRAEATRFGFTLTAKVAPAVAEICRRLDGIPLAIELAATRVAVLSPAEIASRLDDRLTFLSGGSTTLRPRHQTLRGAIDWSHDLLGLHEQILLRRLSVFSGGWELSAAEEVCGADGLRPGQVLEALAGLVAKSLVLADTSRRHARYRLLETVRLYAGERLADSGDADAIRAAHARWCTRLAAEAEVHLTGAGQEEWLGRLESENANLRVALDGLLAEGRGQEALRLAGSLVLFWRVKGHFLEGRGWLDSALALAGAQPPPLRAKALWGSGFLALMSGDPRAVHALEESLSLCRRAGDTVGEARALLLLGNLPLFDSPDAASPLLEESAALARQAGDSWCLAHALGLLGRAALNRGDTAEARPLLEECLAVGRRAQDLQSLRVALLGLGDLAMIGGEWDAAEALLTEDLAVSERLGEAFSVGMALVALGDLAAEQGRYPLAAERLGEAADLARRSGAPALLEMVACSQGRLALDQGDVGTARARFEEARSISAAPTGRDVPDALLGMGEVHVSEGDLQAGGSMLEQALAAAREAGDKRTAAAAMFSLGNRARKAGDFDRSAPFHQAAAELRLQIGHYSGLADSLEALGGLIGSSSRSERAVRLFGAASCLRASKGLVRRPAHEAGYRADVEAVRRSLGGPRFEAAWARGRESSVKEALAQAGRGRGSRARSAAGWESLTRAQREVVAMLAKGLTNAQVAERLGVSPRTVESHLSAVYAKLQISSRTQLVAEASRRATS